MTAPLIEVILSQVLLMVRGKKSSKMGHPIQDHSKMTYIRVKEH
jgi:hypothetical protein